MPYEPKGEKAREHIKGAPQEVNDTYNAIMRDKFHGDDSEENQSQAAAIAWSQHNKHKDSSIDSAGTDNGADKHTCPKCDAKLNPSVGFERCPVCGHVLDKDKVFPDKKPKNAAKEWRCPNCGSWSLETLNPGGRGVGWHDCEHCGYSEHSPTDFQTREPGGDPSVGVEPYQDRLSKYQVIALGELQQPGGVGATQTTGPVDGSGVPEAPYDEDFADAGRNGFEQNVALQTWVNYAVDMLNRGRQDEEILAQLAHDGCPEPEAVLHRAKEQPEDVSPNEGAQDPFDIPFKEVQPTAEESLSQQPPVSQMTGSIKRAEQEKPNIFDKGPKGKPPGIFGPDFEGETKPDIFDEEVSLDTENVSGDDGSDWDDSTMGGGKKDVSLETTGPKAFGKGSRVQIKGSSIKGRVVSVLEDLWGQRTVKVALEEGGHLNVAEDRLALEGQTQNPVADIQSFIDSIPPVEPTHPSILARLENLEQVRRQVRAHISKVGFSDQLQLERFDHEAQDEIRILREALGSVLREGDLEYLRNQPKYRAGDGSVVNREFSDRIVQHAAVWYAEQDPRVQGDQEQLIYAAAYHAEQNNGDVRAFVAAVKQLAENKR